MRFEDIVTRPIETCDGLYRSLGVRWAEDGKFEFKVKPYGDCSHGGRKGVEDKDFIRIGAEDVVFRADRFVRSTRGDKRAAIRHPNGEPYGDLTGTEAAGLGYTAAGSSTVLA